MCRSGDDVFLLYLSLAKKRMMAAVCFMNVDALVNKHYEKEII